MRSLSDKYIAGFLDADGSIGIQRTLSKPRMWLEFHQKVSNDGVIELIHKALGRGSLHVRETRTRGKVSRCARLAISGQQAVDTLCRLKPYLVTRRELANRLLRELGFAERVGSDSVPVHPSRAWLAGNFDGDGCLYAGYSGKNSSSIKASIDSNTDMVAGLELAKKAFGGVIETRGSGKQVRWTLHLDASKAIRFLSYFADHLLVKREQAQFVLGCARMGHFRDAENIVPVLKVMKTHPHRLSDLATEVDVSGYLSRVRDLQPSDGRRYVHAHGHRCSCCGSYKLYARGMCNPCWQKDRYHSRLKRQSEQN